MAQGPGPIRRAWYQWKMMRFPWRRKWLVGFDLQGNTFWEFKDALHALRNRRIAKYSRSTHYSEVNVSPSWMQWLRHTRFDPPSLAEQRQEVVRQERMKLLAAQADARWASKPSALDAPDKQQPVQMLKSRDMEGGVGQMNIEQAIREQPARAPAVDDQGRGDQALQREAEPQQMPQDPPEQLTAAAQGDAPTLQKKKRMLKEPKDSPWNQAQRANPGEEWQPQGWSPAPARRRG